MKAVQLIPLFMILWLNPSLGQIRNRASRYIELSGGIPLFLTNNNFPQNWKEGERVYGLGFCLTNAKSNYHRIAFCYKEERVLDSQSAYFRNFQLKYNYENTLWKGKYHLSYLGFFYGLGVGFESLKNAPTTHATSEKAYPLVNLGFNFEKFIAPQMALFCRIEADASTTTISQPLKGNVQAGLKFKFLNLQ
jgi:hypothetical protein